MSEEEDVLKEDDIQDTDNSDGDPTWEPDFTDWNIEYLI